MDTRQAALDGALAALAQLAASELAAAGLPGARTPLTGLGAVLIDATPGPVVDMVVATAESADKVLLRGQLVGVWLGMGAAASAWGGPGAARATLDGLGTVAGVCAASRREASTFSSLAAGAAGVVASRAGAAVLRRFPDRRARAGVGLGASAGLALAALTRRSRRRAHADARTATDLPPGAVPAPSAPVDASFAIDGLSPLFTPTDRFYTTDVTFPAPMVDVARWRLRVHGLVDREIELSYQDLLAMDLVEIDATLVCVHNPVGGPRLGSARWLGVPVQDLLDRAGVQAGAQQLVARAVDGFTAGVPVDRVRPPHEALVVVAMNGEPLPVEHGFPARLLVPGLWGADANTKWLGELEATTWEAVSDYWDRRGWPRTPPAVRPGSRIDVPRNRAALPAGPVTIAGVAWAPPSGIEAVDLSIDGGPWRPAELSPEIAPAMWRQWRLTWDAEPRPHELRVRTVGRDRTQRDDVEPPYPVGSSGLHAVHVQVTAGRPSSRSRAAARILAAFDDVKGRVVLGLAAGPAWRARGYPPAPRFATPRPPEGRLV